VVSTDGPDMARSAAGRLASEIALIPTAFGGATWTGGDSPDTAVATFGAGEEQERVELHLGPAGQLRDVLMQRWGNPDGTPFGRYPFGVTVDGERTDAGVTLPATVRAGWWRGTDRQDAGEFFRARIIKVTFRRRPVPAIDGTGPASGAGRGTSTGAASEVMSALGGTGRHGRHDVSVTPENDP
jgi:hypothetical protein